jgi:RNA polymerase sigma-70 factor (ECF subfamily)
MNTRPPPPDAGGTPERPLEPAPDSEASIRVLVHAGDLQAATSEGIRLYGSEIVRFLRVRLRSDGRADEAFSMVCEDFWVGLPGFAWRCSLRTWLFVLARHAASRHSGAVQRVRKRETQRGSAAYDEVCAQVRTNTADYLRTETKQRVRALRDLLDEDQQTLLVLRVERGLPWREIAIVMGEVPMDTSELELERASARVRTRFQVAKKRLRQLAVEAGFIEDKSPAADGDER